MVQKKSARQKERQRKQHVLRWQILVKEEIIRRGGHRNIIIPCRGLGPRAKYSFQQHRGSSKAFC